jgi:hypothetical protein
MCASLTSISVADVYPYPLVIPECGDEITDYLVRGHIVEKVVVELVFSTRYDGDVFAFFPTSRGGKNVMPSRITTRATSSFASHN